MVEQRGSFLPLGPEADQEELDVQPSSATSTREALRWKRWLAGAAGAAGLLALALVAYAPWAPSRATGSSSEEATAAHIVELAGYFARAKGATEVSVSVPISGVDYGLFAKDSAAQTCLGSAVRAAVASAAAQGVQEDDVWVAFASRPGGLLAQVDVAAGEIWAPQVQKNLEEASARLGQRVSIYLGLKRCKTPVLGLIWPFGQAASVPAESVECSRIACPEGSKPSKGAVSKQCRGAACVSDCCDPQDEARSGALNFLGGLLKEGARAVFKPPPPPKVEEPPPPPWLAKVQQALDSAKSAKFQAGCSQQKGHYYDQATSKCAECPERTFQPGGLDHCASCPRYSRRRRADKCTDCAEGPRSSPSPAPSCSYLALATDGMVFTFSLKFKYRKPLVSLHLLQASGFTLLVAGKEHGKNVGKVFLKIQPLNDDPTLPVGGFYVYSKRSVDPFRDYNLTVVKNTTHMCLTSVPSNATETGKEDELPQSVAVDMTSCRRFAKYGAKGLFQMKQPGQLSWPSSKHVKSSDYVQTQGTIPMSFDISNLPYIASKVDDFETCIGKSIALYAGPGFGTGDVNVSALAEPKFLDVPPWQHGGAKVRYIDTRVEATVLGGGASASLLDEISSDLEGLATAVQEWLSLDHEDFVMGGRRLQGGKKIGVTAFVGAEAERSCAGRTCPAGMRLVPDRLCAGASCEETCCEETTCGEYAHQCSALGLLPRPRFPVVRCKGKEDCDDKCCVGRCESFSCQAADEEGGATYCPKHNASKLWYTASKATVTCCDKVLCCTQNRAACDACRKCQSLESYCEDKAKKNPHLTKKDLERMGCSYEPEVPDCNYHVQASFFLHQGADPEPKEVLAVDTLDDIDKAVTGGEDGMAWIWNVNSGEPIMALPGATGPIYAVAAHDESPEYVTIGGQDGQAHTFFWRTGFVEKISAVDASAGPLLSLTPFEEWRLLGLGSADGFIRLWSFHNGAKLRLPFGPKNAEDYEADIEAYLKEEHEYFFAKADPLVRAAAEKEFEEAVEDMQKVSADDVPPNPVQTWGPVRKIVYFPAAFNFATGHGDGYIRFWSALNGKLLSEYKGHHGAVTALCADPADKGLFSGGEDGIIKKYYAPSGANYYSIDVAYAGEVTDLKIVPGTGDLYSSHSDGTVRRWKVGDGHAVCKFQTHAGKVNGIAHTIGGNLHQIITASQDGIARTWTER